MSAGYLADSCALIVFLASPDPERFMPRAAPIMRTEAVAVSSITVWEITRKVSLGKLPPVWGVYPSLSALLRAQGYRISLFFLRLPDANAAMARVASRVRQGGHDIPADTVRRRFTSGLHNFEHHYKQAVDDWVLYDNSGPVPLMLDWGENR